jgi:hypothetical protein
MLMNKEFVKRLLLYLVDQLQDMGASISSIRLIKLLYLIDMEYYQKHKRLLTTINWVFYKYGPYFFEWSEIVRSASLDLEIEEIDTLRGRGYTYRSIEPQDISTEVNFAAEQLIHHILERWGFEETKDILKYVYSTPPIKMGQRGSPLDFTLLIQLKESDAKVYSITQRIMMASESILARDWDTPEENKAWEYLSKGK